MNTIRNCAPPLAPNTATLPASPGIALRLLRTSAAVGVLPVVNVSGVPADPANTGVNVPPLVPPTVIVWTSLPSPSLTVADVVVVAPATVVVICGRIAVATAPVNVMKDG